ncbi:MAG: cation-translocating P-type ATPase [Bacilli bacterium]|nr:cation-translocating P-type ATPase [Bacilli bacterium]
MTVVEAYINEKKYVREHFTHDLDFLAKGLALCSNATLSFGDPTEIALVEFAHTLKLEKDDLEKQYPRTSELPFDSVRKMMSTKNGEYIFTKGAFDEIIKRSKSIVINNKCIALTKKHIEALKKINQQYSTHGLRVLALAYSQKKKIDEHDLIFVGLVAMIDPPRPEVASAVSKLKGAGIRTIMITGDHIDTAYAIAHKLGISDNPKACLTGLELDALSFDELKEKVKTVNVYGRVSPQNKVDIVKALKANQETVAMTGDGVNDAPSLKSADIGIAMGITGTDVAKDASDMILTDDNFASIEKAVEEGRGIFANIRKTVLFLLSSNIAEVFVMFIIVCLGLPAPLIAVHLLWINLVTDSTPAIALGIDPKDKNVMKEKPRKQKENFLSNGRLESTLLYGAVITIGVLIAFFVPAWQVGAFTLNEIKSLYTGDTLLVAQTMAFTTLAFAELFHMLGMSEPNRSFVTVFKHKNKLMYLSFALGIILQLFVVLTPGVSAVFKTIAFAPINWLYVSLLSLSPLVVHEVMALVKYIKRKKK